MTSAQETADKAGVPLSTLRPAIRELARELEALSRKKHVPRPPWFSLLCEQVAKELKEGAGRD